MNFYRNADLIFCACGHQKFRYEVICAPRVRSDKVLHLFGAPLYEVELE